MKLNRTRRAALAAVAAFTVATAAYAFTESNTMPPTSKAGQGETTISGYTVSNVEYVLDGVTPSEIDKVTFDLDAAAGTVKARVVAGGAYADCTNPVDFSWSCDFSTNPTVLAADELSVIAVE